MRLSIATWNINSVRLRLPLVLKLLAEEKPDILCLQETKCPDAVFPVAPLAKAGYVHQVIHGQKGYHGVAILSRIEIAEVGKRDFCRKGDARHASARIVEGPAAGLVVHDFYVPAGGDEPDRTINPKFGHKLDFVDEMAAWFVADAITGGDAVLVGDLNIAPLEHDVWSHRQLLSVVSHTPIEVEKFTAMQAAGAWFDAMRARVPHEEKLYTWWSYRAADWRASNRGRRLDHVWLSPSLAPKLADMRVLTEARGWERPSDHVPVIVELEV